MAILQCFSCNDESWFDEALADPFERTFRCAACGTVNPLIEKID